MTAPDPPTTGEVVRRLDRLEGNVLGELRSMRTLFVTRELFEERFKRVTDELEEVEREVRAQAVTRKQVFIGFAIVVLGEVLALTIALSNLAARTVGIMP